MKSTILALTLGLALAACGSSGPSGTGTGGSSATGGSSGTGGAGATAGTGGPTTYTLTITNYLGWCDLTENGTKYPGLGGAPPAMSFPPGTVVDLSAVPNGLFIWGYWTGTDGDTGAHDTNMSTTVTMNGDKTVGACCPDPPPYAPTCP